LVFIEVEVYYLIRNKAINFIGINLVLLQRLTIFHKLEDCTSCTEILGEVSVMQVHRFC